MNDQALKVSLDELRAAQLEMADRPRPGNLLGMYSAELTTAEGQAWEEFLQDNAVFLEYIDVGDELTTLKCKLSGSGSSEDAAKVRIQRRAFRDMERKVYQVAKTWYAGVKAARSRP